MHIAFYVDCGLTHSVSGKEQGDVIRVLESRNIKEYWWIADDEFNCTPVIVGGIA